MSRGRRTLALALAAAALACAPSGPQPIAYGSESCDVCRMTISEPRFGAEVLTTTGKARKFDSIECLANYVLQARAEGTLRSAWVTDYRNPGTFIAADSAVYLRDAGPHSPMGMRLMAFAPASDVAALVREFGGSALSWPELLGLVERDAPQNLLGTNGAGGANARPAPAALGHVAHGGPDAAP
jgi:copper chaperone NosL